MLLASCSSALARCVRLGMVVSSLSCHMLLFSETLLISLSVSTYAIGQGFVGYCTAGTVREKDVSILTTINEPDLRKRSLNGRKRRMSPWRRWCCACFLFLFSASLLAPPRSILSAQPTLSTLSWPSTTPPGAGATATATATATAGARVHPCPSRARSTVLRYLGLLRAPGIRVAEQRNHGAMKTLIGRRITVRCRCARPSSAPARIPAG